MTHRIKVLINYLVEDVKNGFRGNAGTEAWHLLTLIPFAAFFLALYLTLHIMPGLAAGLYPKFAYWILRGTPLLSFGSVARMARADSTRVPPRARTKRQGLVASH